MCNGDVSSMIEKQLFMVVTHWVFGNHNLHEKNLKCCVSQNIACWWTLFKRSLTETAVKVLTLTRSSVDYGKLKENGA